MALRLHHIDGSPELGSSGYSGPADLGRDPEHAQVGLSQAILRELNALSFLPPLLRVVTRSLIGTTIDSSSTSNLFEVGAGSAFLIESRQLSDLRYDPEDASSQVPSQDSSPHEPPHES